MNSSIKWVHWILGVSWLVCFSLSVVYLGMGYLDAAVAFSFWMILIALVGFLLAKLVS